MHPRMAQPLGIDFYASIRKHCRSRHACRPVGPQLSLQRRGPNPGRVVDNHEVAPIFFVSPSPLFIYFVHKRYHYSHQGYKSEEEENGEERYVCVQ